MIKKIAPAGGICGPVGTCSSYKVSKRLYQSSQKHRITRTGTQTFSPGIHKFHHVGVPRTHVFVFLFDRHTSKIQEPRDK